MRYDSKTIQLDNRGQATVELVLPLVIIVTVLIAFTLVLPRLTMTHTLALMAGMVVFIISFASTEIALYVLWYNQHRPSMALGGCTPQEVYEGVRPANARPRFEPRVNWPGSSPCASPQARIKGARGTKLSLAISYLEGRRHLPIVELQRAA